MDIILINGVNFSEDNAGPQLGLISLKKVLESTFSVNIVNFDSLYANNQFVYTDSVNDNLDRMANYIYNLNPKIVGFYTICNTYPFTILLARKLKELCPKIITIFGGPQVTLTAEITLKKYSFIDIVARGEGENYISELISSVLNHLSLSNVKGIAYRNENGMICYTKESPVIPGEELKNYTLLDMKNPSKINPSAAYSIEAGRGCPYCCSFCSTSIFWGRKFRIKPIHDIIYEIEYLYNTYGIKKFRLEHDLFTANKKYILAFCEAIQKKSLNISWGCSSRIDVLDEEMMEQLKLAGCNSIYIGFETGSKKMQKKLKKNLPIENADKKLSNLHNCGFDLTVSFIYGFKDEEEYDFLETISLIEKLYCNNIYKVQLHKFMPLPNTEETSKVFDSLHEDFSDVDISIYQKSRFNDDIQKIISESKEIHSCFYTFDNAIRTKYKRMDILITCLSLSFKQFSISVKYIVSKYGLINIYTKCSSLLDKCFEDMQNLSLTQAFKNQSTNELLIKYYLKIVRILQQQESTTINGIGEILKYETDLYNFSYSTKAVETQNYYIDIFNSIKAKEIVGSILSVPQTIKFIRHGRKISITTL